MLFGFRQVGRYDSDTMLNLFITGDKLSAMLLALNLVCGADVAYIM